VAAYEVLLLNTAIPQIQAAQTGDTYVVPRDIAFSAALTLSAGTANGVPYLNASKVLTTGSALTFDGTALAPDNTTRTLGTSSLRWGTVFATSLADGTDQLIGSSGTTVLVGYGASWTAQSFAIGGSEQMRLNSSGLEVKQSQLIGYSSFAGIGTNGLAVAGNVGIGTSSPGAKLEVRDTNATGLFSNSATRYGYVQWENTGGEFRIGTDGAFGLRFDTGATRRMTLDTSGNLGLAVTPSAWRSIDKVLQVNRVSLYDENGNAMYLGHNFFENSSGSYIYLNSDFASYYSQIDGKHSWHTAASGTANTTTITNGVSYTIITSGNQTAFGAANNNVGTSFTATSSGTLSSGTVSQNISFTQAMTLDASSRLLVGTTTAGVGNNANTAFTVAGGATVYTSLIASGGQELNLIAQSGLVGVYARTNDPLLFGTNNTERARITSGGYFKASNAGAYLGSTGGYHELRANTDNNNAAIVSHNGTNGTQYGLSVRTTDDQNDATRTFLECLGGATLRAAIYTNGGLSNYSANNVNLASDERLKKDISPLGSTWGKVKAIEVVNFRYKDCNEGDPALFGVIAQQVQPIVPELVVVTQQAKDAVEAKDAVLDADGNVVEPAIAAKEATPEYYGIREQPMYWLAIKALQEAMARIETLEAEVAALKGA
jgi:hypothetical protein